MIQSQTIRKLKPMKSPSTPPQSATRAPKGKASSSLCTVTVSLANVGHKLVVLVVGVTTGSPATLYSIKVQGAKHLLSCISSFFIRLPNLSYSLLNLFRSIGLSHRGSPSTETLLHGG